MKVKDGVIGLVVGDALGVPVEFKSRDELRNNPVTGMKSFGTYGMPAGTFSDDSSMTIATMASIVKNDGEIVYGDIMDQFVQWWKNGKYSQYGEAFDIGFTTSAALCNYMEGSKPLESGMKGTHDNGNGSLMRILPLAFIKDIDYRTVENVSALTHAHERSRFACVFYIELAKSILNDKRPIREHVKIASDKVRQFYPNSKELSNYKRILDGTIFDEDENAISSTGYVLSTLEAVVYVLGNTDSYREAVLKAVNLGDDTDTVGAIVGGIAGIYYGFEDIPEEWIHEIRGVGKVLELCEKFEMRCNKL